MSFDLIEMLRRANVFGGMGGGIQMPEDPYKYRTPPYFPEQDMGGFQERASPYDNVDFGANNPMNGVMSSQYDEIDPADFTPEDKYSRMFTDLLGQMPQRKEPHKLRQIAAVLGDMLTGNNISGEILYGKQNRELADWKQRADVVGRAATDERARNTNERIFSTSTQSARLRERDIIRKEEYDRNRVDAQRRTLDLAKWKAENPNRVIKEVRNGNIVAIDPQNPTDVIDTGIPSGLLSDFEKHQLGVKRDTTRITNQGVETRRNQENAQENTLEAIDVRDENAQDLLRTREGYIRTRPPRPGRTTATSPSAQAQELVNRATEYVNRNPDMRKYIKIEGRNVSVNAPGGWGSSSPDKATYDKIISQLYPQGAASVAGTDDRVKVVGPNGQTGTMLRSDIAKYPGWKEAK